MTDTELSIDDLVRGFEDTTLPKAPWTHAAHLRVALKYVMELGANQAARKMRASIKRYNAAVGGDPSAYHETITLAWIAVLDAFVRARPRASYDELAAAVVAECNKHYLLRFYAKDTLMSDEARARWVAPDLATITFP